MAEISPPDGASDETPDGAPDNDAPGNDAPGNDAAWERLPDPVRARLADLAAQAAPELPGTDVPSTVRPVIRFAPAKRARLGGAVLLAALRDSAAFRSSVAEWARSHRPDQLDRDGADRVGAAAAAVLLGEPAAPDLVAEVSRRTDGAQLRSERDAALARARRWAAEADRLRTELAEARTALDRAGSADASDAERLRTRLREQGVRLRRALDDAAELRTGRDEQLAAAERALAAALTERDRERDRAAAEARRAVRAVADARAARQAAREARDADEVRLALLVDTIAGAADGLRRELALGDAQREGATAAPRPADQVRGATRVSGAAGRVEDPAALDRLLALHSVHLVVDGYNVTKTGYPELTLAAQRDRLTSQLAALAARTGAEVTLVFDGAGVVSVPGTTARGVRVLFSDAGVLADDVIRSLVSAEPEGRPVVVVTSDRAVADSVRRRGAYPVPSAVLVTRLRRT